MRAEQIEYAGWPNCYRLASERAELVVTADVGPRVIRFALAGDENVFKEYPEQLGSTGGDEWRIYGGHRLWHAPEAMPRTYAPDNGPVAVEPRGDALRLVQPVEATTGIQKELDVSLAADEARATVTHRLRNTNLWPLEVAPWAVSVMAPGGVAVVPLPPRRRHEESLVPANTLALWAYTDMTDARWTWGARFVLLRQQPGAPVPQKAGLSVPEGWAAYARDGRLFVKAFDYVAGGRYPDLGSNVEAFTNAEMLELETLAPLSTVPPGGEVEYTERWALFASVPPPASDGEVEWDVLPKVRTALSG